MLNPGGGGGFVGAEPVAGDGGEALVAGLGMADGGGPLEGVGGVAGGNGLGVGGDGGIAVGADGQGLNPLRGGRGILVAHVVVRTANDERRREFHFRLPRENMKLQLRGEFFNLLNKTNYYPANANRSSNGFGTINRTFDPRQIQLALKLNF